jgi:ceramide glucosyltransferase
LAEFPSADAQLVVCSPLHGANIKVAKLGHLERLAQHQLLVISDADVKVPPDFLANVLAPLERPEVGLVNCFYCLSNPSTRALQLEAVAINADFWSQVLQARDLKPLDFALGAAMATRRQQLKDIGGFATLANCLADDYQLGNRIAQGGHTIALSPVVVECWSREMNWREVWSHQLRWARTVRVCQPLPYFFSVLSNATFWPCLWALAKPSIASLAFAFSSLLMRILIARNLQARLLSSPQSRLKHQKSKMPVWIAPLKDLLQIGVWFCAFVGNRIEWAGRRLTLQPDGTLKPAQ